MVPTFTVLRSGPHQLSNTAATLYTVPGSTTTTFRSITVTNTDSADRTFCLSIGTDDIGTRIFSETEIQANKTAVIDGEWSLEAGEVIQAFADVASKVNITLNGFKKT